MEKRIEQLFHLREKALSCKLCPLGDLRTNLVFGDIPTDCTSNIMVVGEAPGETEDLSGRPFAGRTGGLLQKLLDMAGLPRPNVFVTNCLMCRPPKNRSPLQEELTACRPWLDEKIALFQPHTILAVGRFAAAALLSEPPQALKITKLSGRRVRRGALDIVPLVHPSFVARGGMSEVDYFLDIVHGLYDTTGER